MLPNNRMSKHQNFGRVLISSIYKRNSRVSIKTEEDYMKQFNMKNENQGGLCEIVGLDEYQVKPYFDIDIKDKTNEGFNEEIINDICKDIQKIYNNDVYIGKREPREANGVMKYSYRLYLKARITWTNIPVLFKEVFDKYDIIDKGVYDKNRTLFAPLSDRKKDLQVPALINIKGSIFDCCATFIYESYQDLDIGIPKIEPKPKANTEPKIENKLSGEDVVNRIMEGENDIDKILDDGNPDKYNRLNTLISKLSPMRSEDYHKWTYVNWCLMNICDKEKIPRRKCMELIHQFSKLSKSKYDENTVDTWIDEHINVKREVGYGWVYLLNTCIKEDNPKYYETISQSYTFMKKEFENTNAKILYPPMVVHLDRKGENIIQPIPLCEKTNRHLECSVKETNKKGEDVYKKKRFIELWLNDPTIRKYENFIFKPYPLKVEEYEYNTWTDFEIKRTPYVEDSSIIVRFLDYMNNLFNDEAVVNYILAYFANRIKNPAIRNNVCIILYGEEGDGKNRLFDTFKNIVGEKYFIELENAKQLFGTHSCIEQQKLFVCVNEAKGKDNYENSETLKSRITTSTLQINPKGIQGFEIDNFCDYLMTTNNANAVDLKDKSRRYLYVETTSYYSRNSEFFNSFSEDIVDNKNALRNIYEYLMKFDIKTVVPTGNFQNHIPITEIQKQVIKNNRDKILYFLEDLVNEYLNDKDDTEDFEVVVKKENDIKIKNHELFSKWNKWIEKNKMDLKYNNIAFHSRLGQLMNKRINIKDKCIYKDTNCNTFIRISQLKEFFTELNE